MPKETLPQHLAIDIEEVLGYAKFLFLDLQKSDVERSWDKVFEHFAAYSVEAWAEFTPVDDFEFDEKHWAAAAGQSLKNIPWRLVSAGKSASGLDCYAEFFQTDQPKKRPIMNFKNVTLEYDRNGPVGSNLKACHESTR